MKTEYIEVIAGKYTGSRGYIKRIINGSEHPNECMIYNNPGSNAHKVQLKDSEIKRIN